MTEGGPVCEAVRQPLRFIVTEKSDGLIQVQNLIMGLRGQHHVHTREGFQRWKKIAKVDSTDITVGKGACRCGLKPGDVREYDGRIWHDEKFE